MDTDDTFDAEQAFILELANVPGRRVATPEGARFYGQPIGTIITKDMIKAAKLKGSAAGKKAPKGGLSPKPAKMIQTGQAKKLSPAGNYGSKNKKTPFAKPAAKKSAIGSGQPLYMDPPVQPGTENAPAGKYAVKAPSIKGPQGFKVGNSNFSAPAGSKLFRAKNQPDVAYVVTPDNTVHVFNPAGEVVQPEWLEPVLVKKFKDLKGDDKLYKADTFDEPAGLADQAPGSKLSKNGKPAFTKQASGTWMNEDIGVELADEDLQRLFDQGEFELEPANTVEDVDFSKLSADELEGALDAMPEGKQLKFSTAVMTKRGDGWESSITGKSMSGPDFAGIALHSKSLTDKLDNPEALPEVGKEGKAKKEGEAKDPLRNAETEVNEKNLQKKKAKENLATPAEVLDAEDYDTFYHDVEGPMTKIDADEWMTFESKIYQTSDVSQSANAGFLSKEPWSTKQIKDKEQFDIDLGLAEPKEPEPVEEGKSPNGFALPDDVTTKIKKGKKVLAIKAIMDANEGMNLVQAKKEVEALTAGTTAPGDEMTPSMVFDLPTGSKYIDHKGVVFTKNSNNNWVSPEGGVVNPETTAQTIQKNSIEGNSAFVQENPGFKTDAEELPPDDDYQPIPEGGLQINDLSAFKEGDYLNLQLGDGTTVKITKKEKDWETDEGFIFTDGDVQWDVDNANAWVAEEDNPYPDEGDVDEPTWPNGYIFDSVEEIDDMQPGEQISVVHPVNDEDQIWTKNAHGDWTPDETGPPFNFYSDDFAGDIADGSVSAYNKSPQKPTAPTGPPQPKKGKPDYKKLLKTQTSFDDLQADAAELGGGVPESSKNPVPKFDKKLDGFMDKGQVEDAIKSLEAHSGFQIGYGLKALPNDHPLKDSEYLDKLKADSKEAYPDLAPKKAFVKYLKAGIGDDSELADWEKELLDTSPQHQIGSKDSKKTQTGDTGGSFSEADIKDAIQILENYDGKLFKNELNKHGNPLGKLSPNNIVGFDKDKSVTKQKFLDLLKKKVGAPTKGTWKVGDSLPNSTDPENFEDGTKIKISNSVYTKVPEGWEGSAGSTYPYLTMKTAFSHSNGAYTVIALPGEEPSAPERSKVGDTVVSEAQLDALPLGSVFEIDGGHNWTKGDRGWEYSSVNGPGVSSGEAPKESGYFAAAFKNGNAQIKQVGPSGKEADSGPKVGDKPTVDVLENLPIGSSVAYNSGEVWVKSSEDKWIQEEAVDEEIAYPSKQFGYAISQNLLTIQGIGDGTKPKTLSDTLTENTLSGTRKLTGEELKELPLGSVVDEYNESGNVHETWTKISATHWQSSSKGDQVHNLDLAGFPVKVTQFGNPDKPEEPKNSIDPTGVVPDNMKDGDAFNISTFKFAPVGTVAQHENSLESWVKIAPTKWRAHSTGSEMLASGMTQAVKSGGMKLVVDKYKKVNGNYVKNMAPGTTAYYLDGSGSLTKKPDGGLVSHDGVDIDPMILGYQDKFSTTPIGGKSDTPQKGALIGHDLNNMPELDNAPVGSIFVREYFGKEFKYEKQSDGKWSNLTDPGLDGSGVESHVFANSAKKGALKWDFIPDKEALAKENANNGKPYKPIDPANLDLYGIGARLQVWDDKSVKVNVYTKKAGGWFRSNGEKVNDDWVQSLASAGNLEELDDEPMFLFMDGDKITSKEQILGAPVGQEISVKQSVGPDWNHFKKNADGSWDDLKAPNVSPFTSEGMANVFESLTPPKIIAGPPPHVGRKNKMQVGDVVEDMGQFEKMVLGDIVNWQSPHNADKSNDYTKTVEGWAGGEDGDVEYSDGQFEFAIQKGLITYKGNDNTDDSESTLDSVESATLTALNELDEAVSILPAGKRGATGDGFVVVMTPDGPKQTWGKFGAGGIAAVATDENGVKKVLVGKRGDRDEWYLPGGAIDEKESHLQGALREFSEEVDGGDIALDKMKIVAGYQANIGKISGTDKDWKYVTSVADIGEMKEFSAPPNADPWELSEYKWYSAEELQALDNSGKLHGALANGKLASMVGFTDEATDLKNEIADLLKGGPPDLAEEKFDIKGWKKISGGQGGSNPGGVYEDQLGNKWYVKQSNSGAEAAHNEVVAGALYSALGVHSNEIMLVSNGNSPGTYMATPWIENDGKKLPNSFDGKDPAFIKAAQADFAIDAWLDNYDVAGIGPWNLVADDEGKPLRLDPGGAMLYRASGGKKSWWSDEPTAIDDMRFGSKQSSAYSKLPKLFGDMTDDDVKESAKKLLNITPEQINDIVMSSGMDDETKAKLTQTLITRRQKILDRFGLTPQAPVIYEKTDNGYEISDEVKALYDTHKPISAMKAFKEEHNFENFMEAKAEFDTWKNKKLNEEQKQIAEKPGFAKGTTVKPKGGTQEQGFEVELSNNEVSSGLVNGAYVSYLNDELTAGGEMLDIGPNYAFSVGGESWTFQTQKALVN